MGHSLAWLGWLAALLTAVSLTRNPLYLVLLLLETVLVLAHLRREDVERPLPVKPLRFAGFAVLAGASLNALTTHFGETVLFQLPTGIPLLGGPVTAEGIAYGATNGLVLSAIFAAFTALNLAVPVRDLVRWIPKAFYPITLVITIAVTFVPSTLRQMQQVRDAQAIRGHRMRGLRDWLPLFMPLLVGGLERAFQLAEAMTARGFAASAETPPQVQIKRFVLPLSLGLILAGGLLHLVWGQAVAGLLLILVGTGLFLWNLHQVGHGITRTTYRHARWTSRDGMVLAGAGAAMLALWIGTSHAFTPYPRLTWPGFSPETGALLLGFLAPLLYSPEPGD